MSIDHDVRRPLALIGGELHPARSGRTIETHNPATGAAIGEIPRCDAADVDDAVAAAAGALPSWIGAGPLERAAAVRALADAIVEHRDELALLDVEENGSPIREMRNDAHAAAAALRYFAGLALELRGETIPGERDHLNYTLQEPFGVVGRIIPFNHPLMFAAAKIAAPLIAGNTVIIKPSEHTSLSALRLGELARGILPAGVLNVITGLGQEAGDALVTHPEVRRVAFIGAADTGRHIQQRAATHVVKTVTLELGGKNPLVVLPDADLELAAEAAVHGMNFTWQGQSCGSTSRLLVHTSIHRAFVASVAARIDALRSGWPTDEKTDTGAIVHRGQYEKVLEYIRLGREEGARLVVGGGPVEDPEYAQGMFLRPTLFDEVDPGSRLAQEEIFGPVLAAIPFSQFDDAVRIANGVNLGLTASIYTRDLAVAHRFARDVQAGYVWVNNVGRHFAGAPYGGVKDSGVGREESFDELLSYTQTKNVNIRF